MTTSKLTKLDIGPRPICPECGIRERTIGYKKPDGSYYFQKVCTPCKHKHLENKNGVKYTMKVALNAGFSSISEYQNDIAIQNGFASFVDYRNSKHISRQYRKDYCENVDGRLNFFCTSTIMMAGQLDVDHIDGNPKNNDPSNYQTLCKCCHTYKTIVNKDGLSPGRKTLGIKK